MIKSIASNNEAMRKMGVAMDVEQKKADAKQKRMLGQLIEKMRQDETALFTMVAKQTLKRDPRPKDSKLFSKMVNAEMAIVPDTDYKYHIAFKGEPIGAVTFGIQSGFKFEPI